jgi:hypothetical protein
LQSGTANVSVNLTVGDVDLQRHEPDRFGREVEHLLSAWLVTNAVHPDRDVWEALPPQPWTPASNGRQEAQECQHERYIGFDHLRACT